MGNRVNEFVSRNVFDRDLPSTTFFNDILVRALFLFEYSLQSHILLSLSEWSCLQAEKDCFPIGISYKLAGTNNSIGLPSLEFTFITLTVLQDDFIFYFHLDIYYTSCRID